jgi:undecaprenyl-diphosphatase
MADPADTGTTWVRRWRLESVRIALSLLVLVVATVLAVEPPADWEVSLFRAINDLTSWWGWVLWVITQAGFVMAIPLAAVILYFLVRHWRPPLTLLGGGLVFAWAGSKVFKVVVDRGRPGDLLGGVKFGYDVPLTGFGYPSGHTAVAFAIVAVLSPYLPRWLRWALYGLAVLVAFARVYMGAHMPLDVVGGAAYGLIVGSVVNLVSGIRAERARPEARV